ncbi:olfactory receptor 10D3-like, partial [Emydura macquarii macquarii]|uniref:olfactory receptor 10D3-like n=1 Tax=Emydura macquarii macquarii TaxID=1129001 RepID=UPI00352A4A1D
PNTDGLQTILFVVFLAFYLCTLLGNLLILLAILGDCHLDPPMNDPVLHGNGESHSFSLAFYLCTLLGNLLIFSAILADSILHTPVYLFLCNLSVVDLGFASISTPKLLISNSFHATILTSLTFTLPHCGPNVIDFYFCDIFPVAKLACTDTYIIETVSFSNNGLVPMTCFLLILMSYVCIIYSILKMNSAEGLRKSASTCASHLTVVTLFFGPCALVYMQPRLSKVVANALQISANVATPVLNPVIYTLRNKEMKGALRKLRGGQTTAR